MSKQLNVYIRESQDRLVKNLPRSFNVSAKIRDYISLWEKIIAEKGIEKLEETLEKYLADKNGE